MTAALPWLGHAALGFADPEPDRRWRAAWRSGLLLGLVAAFTPVAWFFAAALIAAIVGVGFVIAPATIRDRTVWGPPVTMLAAVPVLLAPWWLPADRPRLRAQPADRHRPAARAEPGLRRAARPAACRATSGLRGGSGLALVVMAVLALIPSRTRVPVLVVWIVALVAAGTSAVLAAVLLDLPVGESRPGLGFFLVVLKGAFVVATFIAIHGLATRARRTGSPLRRLVPVALTAVMAIVPLLGLAWFVLEGPGELTDDRDTGIPAYMVQDALRGPAHGILVIRGSVEDGLTYAVRRGDGVTIGEDEILAATPTDAEFDELVQTLTSRPRAAVVAQLAAAGVQYVVLPSPADGSVAAGLDASGGLDQASAEDRSTRAWQVSRPVDEDALDGPTSWFRIALLVLQGIAIVVVLVLCAPTSERSRARRDGGRRHEPGDPTRPSGGPAAARAGGARAAGPPQPDRRAGRPASRSHDRGPGAGAARERGRVDVPAARDRPQPLDPDLPEQPRRHGRRLGRECHRPRGSGRGDPVRCRVDDRGRRARRPPGDRRRRVAGPDGPRRGRHGPGPAGVPSGPRAGGGVVPRTRLRAVVHGPRRRGAALVGPRAGQPRPRPGRRGHHRHRRARPRGRSVLARHHRARRAEPAPGPRPGDPDAWRAERPRRGLARPPRRVRRRHLRRAGPRRRRHRLARRPGAGHRPAAARPADREGHPLPGRGQRRRRRGAGRHPGGHQGLRVPARGPRRRDRAARLGDPGPAQRDPRSGGAGRRARGPGRVHPSRHGHA